MYLVKTIACTLMFFLSQNAFSATALWNAKICQLGKYGGFLPIIEF